MFSCFGVTAAHLASSLQLMQQTTLNEQAEAEKRHSTVSLRRREGDKNIFATLVIPNPLSLFSKS